MIPSLTSTFIYFEKLTATDYSIIILTIVTLLLGYIAIIKESSSLKRLAYYLLLMLVLIDICLFEISADSYKAIFCFFYIPIKVYIMNKVDSRSKIYRG